MKITRDQMRKMTKAGLMRRIFDVNAEEVPVGDITLAGLPGRFFQSIVTQHNEKVQFLLTRCPDGLTEVSLGLQKLLIPTFAEYQTLLDDPDQKKSIRPEYRKAKDFATYQKWVLRQEPIKTVFAEVFMVKAFPAYIPEKHRAKHTFIVGKSGFGKSECLKLLILSSKGVPESEPMTGYPLVNRKRSVLLLDPHGKFAHEMLAQRHFYGDLKAHPDDPDVIYIDPFLGAEDGLFPTLNPFDISQKHYSPYEIEKIAQQLSSVFQSLVEAQFSANMKALMIPCITVLLHRGKQLPTTIFDLQRFLQVKKRGQTSSDCLDLVDWGRRSQNEGIARFFREDFFDRKFNTTKQAMTTRLQALLNNEIFINFLARPSSTIDLEAALNQGKTIIVNCAAGKVGEDIMQVMGRFLVGMAIGIAFNRAKREEETGDPGVVIDLVLDELQNFVSENLKVILAQLRKYNLRFTGACQVLGQDMSPDLTKILTGNTDVQILTHAGANTQRRMALEMNVREEDIQELGVGEFMVRCGVKPALKIKMCDTYIDKRNFVQPAELRKLKGKMVELYYRNQSPPDGISEGNPSLMEGLENMHISNDSREQGSRTPKFGFENPFADLDL